MFYYTYVLKSLKDKNLYIGWTDDLKSRFHKHDSGQVEATKHRRPLILIYYEACQNKENRLKGKNFSKLVLEEGS